MMVAAQLAVLLISVTVAGCSFGADRELTDRELYCNKSDVVCNRQVDMSIKVVKNQSKLVYSSRCADDRCEQNRQNQRDDHFDAKVGR